MSTLIDTPKYSDLIYDIGMHKGEDAEFYLRKGFRVVAFEADGDLAALGRIRLRKYLELGQLTIVEGAIVSRDAIERGEKTVQFYKNDGNSVWGTLSIDWARRNARLGSSSSVVEVDTIDLVSVLEERGIPHYMKIDIEGCDLIPVNVLNMFRERPDYISIESDKTSFKNIKREINALSALGYSSFQAVEQSTLGACNLPPCPPREGVYVSQHFEEGSSGLFGAELKAEWESRHAILRRYRAIRLGYYLLGDDGLMTGWAFRGAQRFRSYMAHLLRLFTRAAVPGWYDTHARHSSVRSATARTIGASTDEYQTTHRVRNFS